jgi:transposase-like protein
LSTNEPSRFSREFKLEALRRMEAGENVSVLARELQASISLLSNLQRCSRSWRLFRPLRSKYKRTVRGR